MNAASMNNLWSYIQGLSLTVNNRKWLAERLIEPFKEETAAPPVLQTWEEAISDLDESEKEFERGDVLSGDNERNRIAVLRTYDPVIAPDAAMIGGDGDQPVFVREIRTALDRV